MTRYENALDMGFRSAGLYNNLGYSQAGPGDFDKAQASLEQAVAMDAHSFVAHFNLAYVLLQRARDALQQGLPIDDRWLADGIRAIDRAQRLSPGPHPQLDHVAACLLGLASGSRPDYAARSLEHLRKAVARGNREEWALEMDEALRVVREQHGQAFEEIRRIPPPAVTPPRIDQLIDPVGAADGLL